MHDLYQEQTKQGKSQGFDNCDRPSNLARIRSSHRFSSPFDLVIWWKTIGNLFHAPKICVSFDTHTWIQMGVIVRKSSNLSKIINFSTHVTLKFDRWPPNTIQHLFYTLLSSVHHFVAVYEFKLELQSRNHLFLSKSLTFRKTTGHLLYATLSFMRHFVAICELKLELRSGITQIGGEFDFCGIDIWPLTLTSYIDITFVNGNYFRKFQT